jgi:hypothetical protein
LFVIQNFPCHADEHFVETPEVRAGPQHGQMFTLQLTFLSRPESRRSPTAGGFSKAGSADLSMSVVISKSALETLFKKRCW